MKIFLSSIGVVVFLHLVLDTVKYDDVRQGSEMTCHS